MCFLVRVSVLKVQFREVATFLFTGKNYLQNKVVFGHFAIL